MISISWSVINQWLICPFRVKYDIRGIDHPLSWALAYGDILHHTLSHGWVLGEDWKEVFLAREAEWQNRTVSQSHWDGTFTDVDRATLTRIKTLDLLDKYITLMGDDKPDPKLVEMSLTKELGDSVVLTGRVDAMWGGKIVDWKLTTDPRWLNPLQLLIYAILSGGACESEFHCFIKARHPHVEIIDVPQTRDQDNLDIAVNHIIKPIAKMIEAETFYSDPSSNLCKEAYCSYWEHCQGRFV